jgi:hypothetical protein
MKGMALLFDNLTQPSKTAEHEAGGCYAAGKHFRELRHDSAFS